MWLSVLIVVVVVVGVAALVGVGVVVGVVVVGVCDDGVVVADTVRTSVLAQARRMRLRFDGTATPGTRS